MKAVFLNSSESSKTMEVYAEGIFKELASTVEISPEVITPRMFDEKRNVLKNADFVFSTWGMPALSEDEIAEYLPNLRAVFYAAGSVQQFARPFLSRKIKVFSAWGANAVPVAEFTVAQIVLANKGFYQSSRIFNQKGWGAARKYSEGFGGNYNARVGILGAGMVGSIVIQMLHNYKMEVWVFDPFLSEERARSLNVKKYSLEQIFEECQTISNHLANNDNTAGMLGYPLFSRMKDNASFINTGRGRQVIESGLVQALMDKPGRTAILDVTDPEPPVQGNAFYSLQNVVLTPHIAGSMNRETERMGEYMLGELKAYLNGQQLKYEVTGEMLKTMA